MPKGSLAWLGAVIPDLEQTDDRGTRWKYAGCRDDVDGALARVDGFSEEIKPPPRRAGRGRREGRVEGARVEGDRRPVRARGSTRS